MASGCGGRLSEDVLAVRFDDSVQSKVTSWSTQNVRARQLARSVSHLLHTVTRIVNVQSDAAALSVTSHGGDALLLKVDNTRCVSRCFSSARSAAEYLAVYRARQLGSLNLSSVAGIHHLMITHIFRK